MGGGQGFGDSPMRHSGNHCWVVLLNCTEQKITFPTGNYGNTFETKTKRISVILASGVSSGEFHFSLRTIYCFFFASSK